jgi:hypothetical protein
MNKVHSTAPVQPGKPSKPYPDFPLTPHLTRRWYKKINGKLHYFGRWDDPDGALKAYQAFLDGKVVQPAPTTVQPTPTPSHNKTTGKPNANGKPEKPYADFPLTAHPTGYWCKKIRGRLHYFGKWDYPDGALENYLDQKDAIHAGRDRRGQSAVESDDSSRHQLRLR